MIEPSEVQTRTGTIRGGLEYQDSYAIQTFVEWLEHPHRYEWVRLEFSEAGYLDDLVTASPESGCEMCQIKYSVHPETPTTDWTWKTLLTKRRNAKLTLFEKWSKSWLEFADSDQHNGKTTGYLITNKAADESLLEYLKPQPCSQALRLDLKRLKRDAPSLYRDVLRQTGSERQLERFAANFLFIFDHQELEVLQASARQRLRNLGVNESGWKDLQNEVRLWARKRNLPRVGGKILLDDIKQAVGWHRLRPLLQSFPVPRDFVLFDKGIHNQLLKELESPTGGVKILEGTPGTGKSTYLSYLFHVLIKSHLPCVRHHYFLQLDSDDVDAIRRLSPESARESLIHDLIAQYRDTSSPLPSHNPHPRDLHKFVQAAAEHAFSAGQALIIIVDGLDHVVRERDAKELKDLLTELLFTTRGLWLILGSRPLANGILPTEIHERAPQSEWLRLSGWDKNGSKRFLWHHRKDLKIDRPLDFFNRVADSFHDKSKGHPLYSRKLLQELQKISGSRFINERDVSDLTVFPDDLEQVYAQLWRGASSAAQQVAVLLAVAGIPLKIEQFLECLGGDAAANEVVQDGILDLAPFVEEQERGLVFFHSSFKEFVVRSNEFRHLSTVVLERLKNWLTSRAPEDIRWAHLHRIEYQLGDSKPLLSATNRAWIIQSICEARAPEQIIDQVNLATHAAMEKNNYSQAHAIGIQGHYLREAIEEQEWSRLWLRAWLNNPNRKLSELHRSRLESLSSPVLVRLAEKASQLGEFALLGSCADVLRERLSDYSPARREFGEDEWGVHARAALTVITLRRIAGNIVLRWIKHLRPYGRSKELLNSFGFALVRTRQITLLREVIASRRLPATERSAAIEGAAKAAIVTLRKDLLKDLKHASYETGPWARLYTVLNNAAIESLGHCLPNKTQIKDPEREYLTTEQQVQLRDLLTGIYLGALTLGILGKKTRIAHWIDSLDRWNWTTSAARLLAHIGLAQGLGIRGNKGPRIEDALSHARSFPIPEWPQRRSIWGAWKVLRSTFREVLTATAYLQNWQEIEAGISASELAELRASRFLGRDDLLELLASSETFSIRSEIIERFLEEEKAFRTSEITYFPERMKFYTYCAEIAGRQGLAAQSADFVRLAASNSVAYGYHKDMYLYEVIEGIEACHQAGSTKCLDWLKTIAPLVESVGDFTDGDETRHFRVDLASTLRLVSPNSLFDYYVGLVKKEDLFLAEDVFPEVIETLDFSDPLARSLVLTIVDSDSFSRVRTAAQKGNIHAQSLVKALTAYFNADEPDPPSRSSHSSKQSPIDYSSNNSTDELLTVRPSDLRPFLKKIEDRQSRLRRCGEWVSVWLNEPTRSKEVYRVALDWLDANVYGYVEPRIFERLVPYAFEFDGVPKAFTFLCDAHRASYGWSRFAHSREDIQRIWTQLRSEFPDKWRNFISKTCLHERFHVLGEQMTFLPVPRGAEFLAQVGALKEAEGLTNASVEAVVSFGADLKLPPPYWLVRSHQSDLIDILFARLEWPSAVIRERAATSISILLCDENTSSLILERLTEWLANTKEETLAVVGLLPIAKAARQIGDKLTLDTAALRTALSRPSIVSDLLVSDIEKAVSARK